MTPEDLMYDLRGRIDNTYAEIIGTESWERKCCADAIDEQIGTIEQLKYDIENWQKMAGFVLDEIVKYDSANDDPHAVMSIITDILETAFGHMPSALEKLSNLANKERNDDNETMQALRLREQLSRLRNKNM